MATYVLCHGGWAGGWQWRDVASILRAAGHEVYTPTLTGLGERAHLAHRDIDLDTHIQDILMVLKYENLHQIILVGYSYSGMVITGVAEQAPERIARLVYLDAFVPKDGQSMAELMGPEIMAAMEQATQAEGDGWRVPPQESVDRRDVAQPIKTGLQPVTVRNLVAAALPRTFISCTQGLEEFGPMLLPVKQAAENAKASPRWRYRELNTGHQPWLTAPQELADVLLELA